MYVQREALKFIYKCLSGWEPGETRSGSKATLGWVALWELGDRVGEGFTDHCVLGERFKWDFESPPYGLANKIWVDFIRQIKWDLNCRQK